MCIKEHLSVLTNYSVRHDFSGYHSCKLNFTYFNYIPNKPSGIIMYMYPCVVKCCGVCFSLFFPDYHHSSFLPLYSDCVTEHTSAHLLFRAWRINTRGPVGSIQAVCWFVFPQLSWSCVPRSVPFGSLWEGACLLVLCLA